MKRLLILEGRVALGHLRLSPVLLAAAAILLALPVVVHAGPPDSATVRFGNEQAGSPFPPGQEHDASFHAADSMIPRTVVISAGGSVTYEVAPFHQVAIYQPGTTAADVEISENILEDLEVPFPPFVLEDFVINDPDGRVALSPPLAFVPTEWTTPESTFDQPGRYLVICTTAPHFAEADMYGWVIVR